MTTRGKRICPVERAGHLDNRFRRWLQNPQKILKPYITEGMTVLDLGCGPGFFSIDLAAMVGDSGCVIACDLQEGMLRRLKRKMMGTGLQDRILLHRCEKDGLGVSAEVDFVLAFYMVHEVPDPRGLFEEISSILRPQGQMLMVEPPFHVSKRTFEETIRIAGVYDLLPVERPRVLLSRAVRLEKR